MSQCSDTFNENSPPTTDPAYISSLGAAVYKAMSEGDKDAVWLMQVCFLILQTTSFSLLVIHHCHPKYRIMYQNYDLREYFTQSKITFSDIHIPCFGMFT